MISVKNEKLISSWDKLEPSETADLRMRAGILEQNRRTREKRELERGGRTKAKRLLPIVACLAVLVLGVGGVWGWSRLTGTLKNPYDPIGPVQEIVVLEFNDSYYEITDKREVLERLGLPGEITAELAGSRVTYLRHGLAGEANYEVSAEPTDVELLEYAPAPSKGAYILRDGERYTAALFANLHRACSNSELLYQIYGIGKAEDIVSVTELDLDWNQILEEAITDRSEIEAFYQASRSMTGFGSVPDMTQSEERTFEYHKDHRYLWIEAKSGLRFVIDVYPSFGILYASGTMAYYVADEAMTAWFARNLK